MDRRPAARPPLVSTAAAVVVACVGALVLIGWVADIESLKSVYGPITMKANTAVALLLAAVALTAFGRGWRVVAVVCAAVIGVLGALTLSEHLVGWNLGIDELLFHEAPGAAAT